MIQLFSDISTVYEHSSYACCLKERGKEPLFFVGTMESTTNASALELMATVIGMRKISKGPAIIYSDVNYIKNLVYKKWTQRKSGIRSKYLRNIKKLILCEMQRIDNCKIESVKRKNVYYKECHRLAKMTSRRLAIKPGLQIRGSCFFRPIAFDDSSPLISYFF